MYIPELISEPRTRTGLDVCCLAFSAEQITTAAPGTVFDASWASASLLGANFFDNAGRRIAGEGDVDGDGRPDLIIAAYKNDEGGGLPEEGGDGAGKIYLVLNPY